VWLLVAASKQRRNASLCEKREGAKWTKVVTKYDFVKYPRFAWFGSDTRGGTSSCHHADLLKLSDETDLDIFNSSMETIAEHFLDDSCPSQHSLPRVCPHSHSTPNPLVPAARASRFSYTTLHHCPFLTGDSTILTIAFYEKQLQVKRAHPRVPQDDKTYAAMLNE